LDQRINGGRAYQSVGAGGHGAEAAKLLQVLVVLLLLLVVDLAGALLLRAVVEQVVVLLLVGHRRRSPGVDDQLPVYLSTGELKMESRSIELRVVMDTNRETTGYYL